MLQRLSTEREPIHLDLPSVFLYAEFWRTQKRKQKLNKKSMQSWHPDIFLIFQTKRICRGSRPASKKRSDGGPLLLLGYLAWFMVKMSIEGIEYLMVQSFLQMFGGYSFSTSFALADRLS